MSGPPSARQRARTAAAPCLTSSPPEGLTRKAPAPLRSARAADSCHPASPSRGLCGSRTAPGGQRLCRSCHGSSAGFPPSLQAFGMYCRRTPASRPGLAVCTSQDRSHGRAASAGRRRVRQASVLADRGHRPWAYRGTGGARACRTRRGCGQAHRVVARRPHTPASRNGLLVNWSFTSRAVCRGSDRWGRLPMAGEASRVGAARKPLPWPASDRCGSSALKGYAR
jgi:hypothetical protein